MTKTTYKRKDFIKGLLTVSEGEPRTMVGSVATGRQVGTVLEE